ncbi:MAG: thermonuclease family protein [Hyphomicrobiaceae bacterium]|nr:thermonuclease family protein [Hyphomicrobiaceae bacterium]
MFNGLAVVTAIFRAKLKAATGWVFEQLDAATRPARERLRAITTPVWQLLRTATEFVLQTLDTATRPVRETLGAATAPVRQRLRTATDWLSGLLARPNAILLPVAAGTMALGIAVGRYRGTGLDGEVIVMTMIGGVLMTALLPMTLRGLTDRFPRLARLPVRVVQAAVVVVLATGAAWFAGLGTGKEVVGPASAAAGDLLKLGGMTVRLAGIDVPEREQRCGKDNNKWRCADAAQSALSRVLGGRSVRCRLSGSDEAGRPLGYCSIDGVDINAQLVRQGYVFAQVGLFARYGAQEREARNAKAGMWIGDAQRPEEFRAKAWEEAKRRAPDGCPIKGQVTSGERVYVLPGTPAYERARVLASRGDRWFCSEREAASAGFRAAQRS